MKELIITIVAGFFIATIPGSVEKGSLTFDFFYTLIFKCIFLVGSILYIVRKGCSDSNESIEKKIDFLMKKMGCDEEFKEMVAREKQSADEEEKAKKKEIGFMPRTPKEKRHNLIAVSILIVTIIATICIVVFDIHF